MGYPRWREEHFPFNDTQSLNTGLSPLARGTLGLVVEDGFTDRFIPAGAGNTTAPEYYLIGGPVYPRWRGEHFRHINVAEADHGLSPLARGTPVVEVARPHGSRFIPAGAGNTFQRERADHLVTVYPRWRGEHSQEAIELAIIAGLSPLARGTRVPQLLNVIQKRFIPAGAGNTERRCA